ncbi:GumC family protein [Arenimonas sp. MALMAid1274]|uniref:GumC family protein n=1 Tax=Arenimonas sp. MALMAid1274 TaxID=3411630 RepID=UPI003B9E6B61
MHENNNDSGQPGNGDNLPAPSTERAHALMAQRNQAMSLDLRQPDAAEADGEIDLLSYWNVLLKRRWTVLGAMGIVLATSLVATLLTTPEYRATVSLQIDRASVKVVNVGATEGEAAYDFEFYATQYELLRSRALAQRAAADLGLTNQAQLDRLAIPSALDRVMSVFGGSGGGAEAEAGERTSDEQVQRAATALIARGLKVSPIEDTKIARISFDSPDPAFAVRAANAVANAFIESSLERRTDSSLYAKKFLEERLAELKLKLEDSERQLVEFAQSEQLVSSGGETGSLSEQNLSALNAAVQSASQERIKAEARWRQAQASRGTVLLGELGENSIIQSLQERRATLMAEYSEKLGLYKPAYPLMIQLKTQIDEVDKQIAAEIENNKAAIQAEFLAVQEQERLLAEQLANLKVENLDLQNRSIQYNIFKREVDTNRQLYDGLLQRYKEIGVAAGVTTNNISIVDRAENAARFKPNMLRNLLMGLVAGLALGVLLALVFEFLDDTLKNPEDVEKRLGLSVLGVIPLLKAPMTPAKALEDPRSAFAESYRSVRTALQFSTDHGVPRCLLITSATPSEGKSTTALTLAKNFAQLGKRVLIIDSDLRNPSLHRSLSKENSKGLSNYLAGATKATEVIQPTEFPGLMFMPAGPLPPNPAELLMGPRMLSLLSTAGEKFDQVIIDGPPVMGLADAPILANMATGVLLVVESGETRIAVAKHALKRLVAARAHVIGALMTKFSNKHAGPGYGYGSYNYYAYGGKDEPKRLGKR